MADELMEALAVITKMLGCVLCTEQDAREVKTALALLRRHLEPQPIESAPRDGSDVLVFCPIAVAWVIAVFVDGAWVSDTAEHKPTHWLPLPRPRQPGGTNVRLRTARKILDADLDRYRDDTLGRVHRRWAKCKSAKADEAFWQEMLKLYRLRSALGAARTPGKENDRG